MNRVTCNHESFGRLGEPSLTISQAEDSTQSSGLEKNECPARPDRECGSGSTIRADSISLIEYYG